MPGAKCCECRKRNVTGDFKFCAACNKKRRAMKTGKCEACSYPVFPDYSLCFACNSDPDRRAKRPSNFSFIEVKTE